MHGTSALTYSVNIVAAAALFNLTLTVRIMLRRAATKIPDGAGDDALLYGRIRAQANFHEFVPLLLALLSLLAFEGADVRWLYGMAALLLVLRISHMLGMDRQSPNAFRSVGALGTWLLTGVIPVWALIACSSTW